MLRLRPEIAPSSNRQENFHSDDASRRVTIHPPTEVGHMKQRRASDGGNRRSDAASDPLGQVASVAYNRVAYSSV